MTTIKLNKETEKQLADILSQENCSNKTELIEQLIRDRWLALQAEKTVVERRGGHPQHLLQNASPDLSERETRKKAIADYVLRQNFSR
ncbi:hypothetical protein [Myxosarcina sp. GI1]|uniref:hypothetical protein n=1 Tax=Myxosarcina sp. GI1 TaxID=1541065 RepID=UPI000564226B|nr:hypothetical protein [Myxosarcina sp. GI1]